MIDHMRLDELIEEYTGYSPEIKLGNVFGTCTVGEFLDLLAVSKATSQSAVRKHFWLWLSDVGLPAPWKLDENGHQIVAVNGALVASVEPNEQPYRGREEQTALAIITAVNTCAGFIALIEGMPHDAR